MLKYIAITIGFTIAYVGFGLINFYQSKNIEPTFINLLKYNLCIIPITFTLNFIVTLIFNKGYKAVGNYNLYRSRCIFLCYSKLFIL